MDIGIRMSEIERKKLCPYCEGTVDVDAMTCIYCGSSLLMNCSTEGAAAMQDPAADLSSQYQPPYNKSPYGYIDPTSNIPPYAEETEAKKKAPRKKAAKKEAADKQYISSMFLLSLGANLFALAWFIFFFSDHGILALEWKTKHWFLYFLGSLPCLYFGWQKLRELA